MTVEPARLSDVPALRALLASVVPDCHPDTVRAVPRTWPRFVVVREGGRIVAAGALQPVGADRAEIRGLAVADGARGRGIASAVVRHLVHRAGAEGRRVVCVTRRPGFFARLGFEEVAPTWLPGRRRIDDRSPRVAHEYRGAA